MIGWLCVIFIAEKFVKFSNWIPYIALVLLMIIGGKMLFDGVKDGKNDTDDTENENLRFRKVDVLDVITSSRSHFHRRVIYRIFSCGYSG